MLILNILSANKFFELFLIGAGSVIVIFCALIFSLFSIEVNSIFMTILYIIGASVALIVYQPHFIATYKLAYKYKLKEHFYILVILPIFFLLIIGTVFYLEFTNIQFDIRFILSTVLAFTLVGAGFHFSKQCYGVLLSYKPSGFSKNVKKIIKNSLYIAPLYGLLNYIHLSNGEFLFFSVNISIPFDVSNLLSFFFYLLIFTYSVGLYFLISSRSNFNVYVVYVSFLLWFTIDYFVLNFFYFIPLFHSMQFLPSFFKREMPQRKLFTWLVLSFFSVFLLFLLPNFLSYNLPRIFDSQRELQHLFVSILLCVNLHHFAMESFIWRRA